jgi:hypothetical protein
MQDAKILTSDGDMREAQQVPCDDHPSMGRERKAIGKLGNTCPLHFGESFGAWRQK